MADLKRTVDFAALGAAHDLLDQHWPIDYADVCKALYEYVAATPQAIVWDAGRNLGLHEGLNYMYARLEDVLRPDDVLIAYDCDEHPWEPGWAAAMMRVFAADPKCGWLSLMSPPALRHLELNGIPISTVGGERVRIPNYPLINTVCAWRVAALRAVGNKFTEPFKWYGGIESDMMPKFTEAGYWVGWLQDYGVSPERDLEDPIYREFKDRHVGFKLPVFPGSFEEFVEQHEKGPSI
jgi:hypothetical protein